VTGKDAHQQYLVLVLSLVATLIVSTGVNWVAHANLSDRIKQVEQQEVRKMISTTWISGGKTRTLTTKWKEHEEDETYEAFLARHAEEVRRALLVFPEDP
jgi:hypothetical protein